MKRISQAEARRLRRRVAEMERDLADRHTAEAAQQREIADWQATAERTLKSLEALEKRVNAGKLLERGIAIAQWDDVPDKVLEAVRVANHLGRAVVFEQERTPIFRESNLLPTEITRLRVVAYEVGRAA